MSNFKEGTSLISLKVMRTMRTQFQMGDKFSFAENHENSEKPDFKEGANFFLSLKIMRTMRSLISNRGQVFFHWNHENYEKSDFKERASFLSLKIMRTMRSLISKEGANIFLWKAWEHWEALILRQFHLILNCDPEIMKSSHVLMFRDLDTSS